MKDYFNRDFWKFSFQFLLVIFVSLFAISMIGYYVSSKNGTEASIQSNQ